MEVATGDEELKSLLQNFNRVSQVLDTTSRAASPYCPVLVTLRPPGCEPRSRSIRDPFRFGFEFRAPRCAGLLRSSVWFVLVLIQ
jgi:hypothetical protein